MSCLPLLSIALCAFFFLVDVALAGVGYVALGGVRQSIDGFGASSAWQGTVSDTAMNSL
jgi:glucuronoarabinoxylan endo-1,4-beta-xylanase